MSKKKEGDGFGLKSLWKQSRARLRERRIRYASQTPPDLSEVEETKCLNCGTVFQGYYCPGCGQSADTKRFTVKNALSNLFVAIFGGNSLVLTTLGSLLTRPGKMIRDYICGCRTRYFAPVQMLFCLVTIYALIAFVFGVQHSPELTSANNESFSEYSRKTVYLLKKLIDNKVFIGLFISFICVFPYKLVFRRCKLARPDGTLSGLNVAEHFFTLVYVSCQTLIVSLAFMPFQSIGSLSKGFNILENLLCGLLGVWTFRQLYGLKWLKSLWLNFVAFTLSLALLVVAIILYFGIAYGVLTALGKL